MLLSHFLWRPRYSAAVTTDISFRDFDISLSRTMARLRLTLKPQPQPNRIASPPPEENSRPRKFFYCRTTAYDVGSVIQRAIGVEAPFTDIRISVLDGLLREETIQLQDVLPPNIKVLAPNGRLHPLDWRDKCEETSLPLPALQPEGTCGNKPGSVRWIGECQFESYPALMGEELPHHRGENGEVKRTLLCGNCRTIARNRLPGLTFQVPCTSETHRAKRVRKAGDRLELPDYLPSRSSAWRFWIRYAWTDVCRTCDLEQKSRHPDGYDGCCCSREQYEQTWLCHRCDEIALRKLMLDAWNASRTILDRAIV